MNFPDVGKSISKFGLPLVIGGTAVGAGTLIGLNKFQNDPKEPVEDRLKKSLNTALFATAGTGIALGVGYTAVKNAAISSGSSSVIGAVGNSIRMPKMFTQPITKATFTKPSVMAGGGLLLGSYLGSKLDKDNPTAGAAIGGGVGAVAGVVGSQALKGINLWKKIGPAGRVATIVAGSLALAVGSKALMSTPNYQEDAVAEPDGTGGYDSRPRNTGVRSRLNTMNANGDIVLGLNNRRR